MTIINKRSFTDIVQCAFSSPRIFLKVLKNFKGTNEYQWMRY